MAVDATGFSTFASGHGRMSEQGSILAGLGRVLVDMRFAQARHRQRRHLAELPDPALRGLGRARFEAAGLTDRTR